jgi:Tol biopolymer transport system component
MALFLLLGGAVAGWLAAAKRLPKTSAPTFRRLTFRSGQLHNARFTPDGQTIVYGATWAGQRKGLYAARIESPESRPFDLDADILAVSPAGQMAILESTEIYGTLLVVPFSGGVPRPVVEQVAYASADWSPDGKDLVVARRVEGRDRLEFPVGKVLYERPAYAPRFSPSGDSIAFFGLETGSVMVISKSGERARTLSKGWFDFPGGAPCWTPHGKEIWFTATQESGKPSGLYAADLKGRLRLVAQMPGELELDDISRDGRVLLAHHTLIDSLWGLAPGDSAERELSWLDHSEPDDLSPDGQMLLFSEIGEAGGPKASVYLRKTDGSPAVRVGDGRGLSLSRDGKWVLAEDPTAQDHLTLIPTGPGASRSLTLSGFQEIGHASFLPDAKSFVFSARERKKRWRIYLFDITSGRYRPVGQEGVNLPFSATGPVSPDGRWFLGTNGVAKPSRYPVEGGEPRPVAGLTLEDRVIRWAADGRSLYIFQIGNSRLVNISLLDPDSGRRKPWKGINARDPAMFIGRRIAMTSDGRSYAYAARRIHSQLYVVEGLK